MDLRPVRRLRLWRGTSAQSDANCGRGDDPANGSGKRPHNLSAMLLSYCATEWMNGKRHEKGARRSGRPL